MYHSSEVPQLSTLQQRSSTKKLGTARWAVPFTLELATQIHTRAAKDAAPKCSKFRRARCNGKACNCQQNEHNEKLGA
eukprot:1213076-Amphidinium_carterae.1